MINFDPKISGVRVTGSEIDEVMHNIIFTSQFISLKDCIKKIHRQESMNWLLDTLRFSKGQYAGDWWATIDWDSIAKLTVLEKYPKVEKQFNEYFGDSWMNRYIRFNH